MPESESLHFRCPCCGQHAPIARLTKEGPFEFAIFRKQLGGKVALPPEARRQHGRRGSAPGMLLYTPTRTLVSHQRALKKRLQELAE